jgi:hypothetical protein
VGFVQSKKKKKKEIDVTSQFLSRQNQQAEQAQLNSAQAKPPTRH